MVCDFERDLCRWFQSDNSDLIWRIQSGQGSKYGTAPLNDVTYQNSLGQYAIINSKNDNSQLSKAILQSLVLGYDTETCLEFWYQLGGAVKSELQISTDKAGVKTQIWKRSGNQADFWTHAYVRIKNAYLVSIMFEGTIFNDINGYIAIGNLKLFFY